MGENSIRLYRAVPGPSSLDPLLTSFSRGGEGILTSFDDSRLPVLAGALSADWDLQVVPFGALVRRVLQSAGEECGQLATGDQMAIAVGQSAKRLPEDSQIRRAARHPGARKALARALRDLGGWAIDLERAAARSEGDLRIRLNELRELQAGVEEVLRSVGRDTHIRQLNACRDAVLDPDTPLPRMLVFLGDSAAPARLDWLRWAAEMGAEVWVVADRHATDGDTFSELASVGLRLGASESSIGAGNRLLNNLFGRGEQGGPEIQVRIFSAADMLAECEWTLRNVMELPEGATGAIYVRDLEGYAPYLKAAAQRFGIGVRIQHRIPLLDNSFARMTLQTLEACAGTDAKGFLPVIRSSYLSLAGAQRALLIDALKESRRSKGGQWRAWADWLRSAEEPFQWAREVLEWRERYAQSPAKLDEWRERLTALVGLLPWHDALEKSGGYDARRDERAISAIQTSLDNEAVLGRVGSDPLLDLYGFASRCRHVWEAADVSVPSEEGIPVVSQSGSLAGVDAVFAMGMLEGIFPRRRSEDPILSDEARQKIAEALPEQPALRTSRDVAIAERDEFYRVCAAARQLICFSYPQTDEDRDNVPAFYLELVRQAVGAECLTLLDHPRTGLAPSLSECLNTADRELRSALESDREEPSPPEITSMIAGRSLHPLPDEPLGVGAVRDVLDCPFRYQARDRLGIRPRSRTAHWARLRQLPKEAGLAKSPDRERALAALTGALQAELDVLLGEADEWELRLLEAAGGRLIGEWVGREFLAREIWPRAMSSVDLNVAVGQAGTQALLPGGRRLAGSLPAISRLRGGPRLIHLYGVRVPSDEEMSPSDHATFALYFLVGFDREEETALEIESPDGCRYLVLLTKAPSSVRGLSMRNQSGLVIRDLSETDDPRTSKEQFYRKAKSLLREATSRIDRGDIRPTPGEPCYLCDFAELCRRSPDFSDEDSPFGEDESLGAA